VLYFLKLKLVILSSSLSSFLMAQLGKEVVLTFYCCFIASSTNVKFSLSVAGYYFNGPICEKSKC